MRASILVAATAAALSVVFPATSRAGTFTTLYTFSGDSDGGAPGNLFWHDNSLYGTTEAGGNGSIVKFDPTTEHLTVLHNFTGGNDGSEPTSLLYHEGTLYGTTVYGGGDGCGGGGCGTVFALDLKTGVETVLYSFPESPDQRVPQPGGLIYENGALYGTTIFGGSGGFGSIFEISPTTGVETTAYNFTGGRDGYQPNPTFLLHDGLLYGTTSSGGGTCDKSECGTVFTFNPATNSETVLHRFRQVSDGYSPNGNLIYRKGLLYGGTTYGGDMSCGRGGCGAVFSVNPATGSETDVLNAISKEQFVSGFADKGASLYETLPQDGSEHPKDYGELVRFDLKTNHRSVVHKFSGPDGRFPVDPLTYSNGAFYGTATFGGNNGCYNNLGCGTIFKYVP